MGGVDLSGVDPSPSSPRFGTETLTLDDDGERSGSLTAVPAALHGGDPLLNPSPQPLDSPKASPHPVSDRAFPFLDPLDNGDDQGDDGVGGSSGAYSVSPNHRRDPSSSFTRQLTSEYSRIVVSDPQKEQDGSSSLVPGGNYVTYLITTRISGGDGGGKMEYHVRRRFRDVVTLADRLADAYRGFFIPARPDKGIVEGQLMYKHEFVEQRRLALEKYLHRLSAHPVIGRSDDLRSFLTGPGNWHVPGNNNGVVGATRQPVGNGGAHAALGAQDNFNGAHPTKGGKDFMGMFRKLTQSMVHDWGRANQIAVEEDKDFLERKEKMRDLEQHLTTSSQQENNRYELERLKRETHEDLLAMLKGFVVNQIDYAQKLASVWADEVEETKVYMGESI